MPLNMNIPTNCCFSDFKVCYLAGHPEFYSFGSVAMESLCLDPPAVFLLMVQKCRIGGWDGRGHDCINPWVMPSERLSLGQLQTLPKMVT